jgi:protein MAK11
MKLMITVGKGEKCMRLWNLITGKKAGVLNFDRGMLAEVGEGKYSSGEGRKVSWGSTDVGEEFSVGFERGALVFGMDSKPKCKIVPEPRTKIHQMSYVQVEEENDIQVLAVSTEDGRVLFYSTRPADLVTATPVESKEAPLPAAKLIAQIGGKAVTINSTASTKDKSGKVGTKMIEVPLSVRVKDFKCLSVGEGPSKYFIVVTVCSDGNVRVWKILRKDLASHTGSIKQIGELLGTCETGNRITCLEAFVMLPRMEGPVDESIEDFEGFDEEASSGSDSD